MEALTGLLNALTATGPIGAYISAVVVSLGLLVIIFARTKDLWNNARESSQEIAFQDRLLKVFDTLTASEAGLRARIDKLSQENGVLRDDVDGLRADLAMVRNQRRRLIEMLRTMKEGRGTASQGEVRSA